MKRATAAEWCCWGVLVGAAAAVDPWGFRPFTTWRWAVVGVLAALAAAATPRWRLPRWALLTGGGLLAVMAVATVTALDPLQALVGHGRRHLGLAGWLVAGAALVAGAGLDGVRRVGRVAVVAGAATGVAAVADLLGWDPFGTEFAHGRIGGLLGQPAYLGALAVLLAPVAVGVAADREETVWWRRAAVLAAVTCGVALVGTQTRGAWLGAAVAAALAWRALLRFAGGHRVVAAGAVAVVGLLVVVGPVAERGRGTFDPAQGGGIGRWDEWTLAAAVVADHPVTGVGPEGYRIAAPAHVDADYTRRHGRDEVIDRAHNGLLDVAASGGLVAAALYAALLAGVVVTCARAIRAPSEPLVAGAAAGVVAWVVQQAVSFPIAEVDPAAWLLAGVVVARSAPTVTSRIATVVAGGLALVLAVGGGLAVVADHELHTADRQRYRSTTAAVEAADRATSLRPDDVDAWYVAARVASTRASLLAVDAGLDRVEDGLRRSPDDPALRALEEELLAERALRSGLAADLDAARRAAEAQIAADPAGPAHYRHLGLVLAVQGDDLAAQDALRRALDLDPDDTVAGEALAMLEAGEGEG